MTFQVECDILNIFGGIVSICGFRLPVAWLNATEKLQNDALIVKAADKHIYDQMWWKT